MPERGRLARINEQREVLSLGKLNVELILNVLFALQALTAGEPPALRHNWI